MNDAASFDAIMQCNLLEVFCEALGAAIFVTDKLDQVTFASIRLLHFFPLRQSANRPHPPLIAVVPFPETSHEKYRRGATDHCVADWICSMH